MTPAEKIVWERLRGRRFAGYKFRRQQPLGCYIVDFFCPLARVVIEIDGESHLGKEVNDRIRQNWLESQALRVVRFWNTEVYDEIEAVEEMIWQVVQEGCSIPLTPDPSPARGEGSKERTAT